MKFVKVAFLTFCDVSLILLLTILKETYFGSADSLEVQIDDLI